MLELSMLYLKRNANRNAHLVHESDRVDRSKVLIVLLPFKTSKMAESPHAKRQNMQPSVRDR